MNKSAYLVKRPQGLGDPRWKKMSTLEVNDFKKQVCWKCEYLGRMDGMATFIGNTCCMYHDMEKRCRHCSPLDCEEKGYFKPRVTNGRRRSIRLLH